MTSIKILHVIGIYIDGGGVCVYLVSHYFVFAIRLSCGKKDAVVEARVCVRVCV